MKKVNLIKYLKVIGEGEYELYINRGDDIGDAISEITNNLDYWSSEDDCDYIDIAVEYYGCDILEEGALRAAQAGYTIEMNEKYIEQIEKWVENLEFEELSEIIKDKIIKDITENNMELKNIISLRKNNYDKYLQIIRDYTYADINE
jgi:Arc/MetJ-type ribon-helix-helix transcriptional regulator